MLSKQENQMTTVGKIYFGVQKSTKFPKNQKNIEKFFDAQ
jgi:hypothetical protein